MLVYCSVQIFIVLYLSVVGVWGRRGGGEDVLCVHRYDNRCRIVQDVI